LNIGAAEKVLPERFNLHWSKNGSLQVSLIGFFGKFGFLTDSTK
jgi:hypothetical protein